MPDDEISFASATSDSPTETGPDGTKAKTYVAIVTALAGLGTFAGAFTFGTLLTLPNTDFPFPDQLDSIRTYLAFAFVMFSSSIFISIAVLMLLRTESDDSPLRLIKWAVMRIQMMLQGAFLYFGFLLLNVVLVQFGQPAAGGVGVGIMVTCFLWIVGTWVLDDKGSFGRPAPSKIHRAAVNGAKQARDKIFLSPNPLTISKKSDAQKKPVLHEIGGASSGSNERPSDIARDKSSFPDEEHIDYMQNGSDDDKFAPQVLAGLVTIAVADVVADTAALAVLSASPYFSKIVVRPWRRTRVAELQHLTPKVIREATQLLTRIGLAAAQKVTGLAGMTVQQDLRTKIENEIAKGAANSAVQAVISEITEQSIMALSKSVRLTSQRAMREDVSPAVLYDHVNVALGLQVDTATPPGNNKQSPAAQRTFNKALWGYLNSQIPGSGHRFSVLVTIVLSIGFGVMCGIVIGLENTFTSNAATN